MNDTPKTNNDHALKAAQWHLRVTSETLTDGEHEEFQNWLFADRKNQDIFLQMCRFWNEVGPALEGPEPEQIELPAPVAFKRPELPLASSYTHRPMAIAAMVLLLLGTVGGLAWFAYFSPIAPGYSVSTQVIHKTRTGKIRAVTLGDGSVAQLNTRTELHWRETRGERRADLVQGEALFDVVRDPQRPFRVVIAGSEIQVLGTRFNVHRKPGGGVSVTVEQGVVQVTQKNPAWTRTVIGGETFSYQLGGEPQLAHPTRASEKILWPARKVQMQNARLEELLHEFERYTDSSFVIKDNRVRDLMIAGSYSTKNIPSVMAIVERQTGVRVTYDGNNFILDYPNGVQPPRQIKGD